MKKQKKVKAIAEESEPLEGSESKAETEESSESPKTDSVSQWKRVLISALISVLFVSGLTYVLFADPFRLNISSKINGSQFPTYWQRLEFVIRYQVIGISWILFCTHLVMINRVKHSAINPLHANEQHMTAAKNVLSNSLEQFVMSFVAQLVSISFLETDVLVKAIPLINVLFIIGRIAFWLGYPKYRTFGFFCSYIPNTILICYNLYKFVHNLF